MKLLDYAPHMMPDEGERIMSFVEGLRDSLFAQVGAQMETFPSYTVAIDIAHRMEARMKNREDQNNKRKRGQDETSFSHGGNSTPAASIGHTQSTFSARRPQAEGEGAMHLLAEEDHCHGKTSPNVTGVVDTTLEYATGGVPVQLDMPL